MSWTSGEIATLKTLWGEGRSAAQIARALRGRSRNAVCGKLSRLGLTAGDKPQRPRKTYGRPKPEPRAKVFRMAPSIAATPLPPEREEPALVGCLTALLRPHCRWPIGSPDAPDFGFCGQKRGDESSYCPAHEARSRRPWGPGQPRTVDELARSLRRYTGAAA